MAIRKNFKCKYCAGRKLREEIINQILSLNEKGLSNAAIAAFLNINRKTVIGCLRRNGKRSKYINHPIEMISNSEAKCSKCSKIKSIESFQFGRKYSKYQYLYSYCNDCRKYQVCDNLNSDVYKYLCFRFGALKNRAKRNNISFSLTKEYFIEQYNLQKGLCFYSDIELICRAGEHKRKNSLSTDRIIPEKGYCEGNIVFCTSQINTCKSDLSLEEIKLYMPGWYDRIQNFLNKESEINNAITI